MTELPRSRALVRMDGPGHIMPVEPVTPPDSAMWRVIHLPPMLAVVAMILLFVAALAIGLLGLGIRLVSPFPGARNLVPPVGALAVMIAYYVFVRVIERRSDIEELDTSGCLQELGLGVCGGLALSLATFVILDLLGGLRIVSFNSPELMLLPFVVQLCTAIVLELVVCGVGFRLIERLLGSWLTLLLTFIFFGAVRLLVDDATPLAVLAVALQAGLLFGVLYMVTRRLWAAIGLHTAWKFAQIALYGDAATAANGPQGFVVPLVVGPDWLTGGPAGVAASVPALLVTAVVVAALLAVTIGRGRIVRPVWQRGRSAEA